MLIGGTGDTVRLREALTRRVENTGSDALQWLAGEGAVVAVRPWGVASLDGAGRAATEPASGSWLALSGHPIQAESDGCAEPSRSAASLILARLARQDRGAIKDVSGAFAIAWFDGQTRRLHLIRDRFGMEPLYYAEVTGGVLFGSRIRDLLGTGLLPGGLSAEGLAAYLTYCFVPGESTLDRDVRQVPAGSWIVVDPEVGVVERNRWYRLSFAHPHRGDEVEIGNQFRVLLEDAVARCMSGERLGAFLSGGMDSSSVVTLARRHRQGSFHTFSYRCAGKSFDESFYARALASEMRTEHHEVEYDEEKVLEIEAAVGEMDIPSCDTGLEVGTWLLGKAAQERADYVLTGDGGDELWGSHPVYAAQRLVGWYEKLHVPGPLHRVLVGILNRLPDSDRKRDWRVKLKRIFPPPGLPRELGPFRWRAYYEPEELRSLLVPEVAAQVCEQDPYRCVLQGYEDYDGPDDGLSPFLYNDYATISRAYFSRLRLIRRFGVEARCPFFDHALVEFGARIPARVKLEGVERTKRLFRAAMRGILPDIINNRTDKLGHSIPFKNWLRGKGRVAERVAELCRPEELHRRGIFRPQAVARLLEEHRQRRHNHAHRLWAICVLELWLRARETRGAL